MAKFFIYPFATAGDRTAVPNPTDLSGSVSYQSGWTADYQLQLGVDPDAKPIPRDKSNQLMFDVTDAIRQYQTHGAPDFITTVDNDGVPFPYDIYSIVRYNPGTGFRLYMSLVNANISLPTVAANWKIISSDALPVGTMLDYAGTALPANYLLCDGAIISRTTYATLFAGIGVLWGSGDGVTTFQLPDMSRTVAIGSGGVLSPIISNTTGSYGGTETHAISAAQLPAHSHDVTNVAGANNVSVPGASNIVYNDIPTFFNHTVTSSSVGSNTPINIMQPSAVVTKIIKYA